MLDFRPIGSSLNAQNMREKARKKGQKNREIVQRPFPGLPIGLLTARSHLEEVYSIQRFLLHILPWHHQNLLVACMLQRDEVRSKVGAIASSTTLQQQFPKGAMLRIYIPFCSGLCNKFFTLHPRLTKKIYVIQKPRCHFLRLRRHD